MKNGTIEFVFKCLNCKQLNVENKRLGDLAQNIESAWKWEMKHMDFITRLLRSYKKHDFIWVIFYKLRKSANFLPVKTTHSPEDYSVLFIQEVIRLHEVPVSIILDRGAQFIAEF